MKKKILIISLFSILVLITIINIFSGNIIGSIILNDNLISISYGNITNNLGEYLVNVNYQDNNYPVECSIDNINFDKNCSYYLKPGNHEIYLRYKNANVTKNIEIENKYAGTFGSTLDNLDEYYLALNGTKTLEWTFDYPYEFDRKVTYTIEDPTIISIENDTMSGLKVGTTTLTATLVDGNTKNYKIIVTDLILPIAYNNDKPDLPCEHYTEEEGAILDKILESRVKEAGVGTRGGVIAAARFLTLEFPYMVKYFYENGRLINHTLKPYLDGEGRYYHKGLYLTKSKFNDIVRSSYSGPKLWGCGLYDQSVLRRTTPNGFTCSGFVTWAMLNGGFDVGDVGAGDFAQYNNDLSDLGPHHEITYDYMKNGNYKVGDFIGRNGHAALIIGIDDKYIYTAESLPPKLMTYTYERYSGIVKDDNLTYVIEMGGIYPNGDGWYTDMWK